MTKRETVMTATPAFEITTVEGVPETVSTRSREPNPFDGLFPTEGHGTDQQKSLVVVLPSATEDEKKVLQKVRNQAQAAAREAISDAAPNGYTARVKAFPAKIGKKEATRLQIWSVDRITRPGAGRRKAEPSE